MSARRPATRSSAEQLSLFDDRLPFASGLPAPLPPQRRTAPLPVSYAAYLRTARWSELRAEALERDGHRCRFCDGTVRLTVHHRRYPRVFGTETVDDLTTMCSGCNVVFLWFRSIEQCRECRAASFHSSARTP